MTEDLYESLRTSSTYTLEYILHILTFPGSARRQMSTGEFTLTIQNNECVAVRVSAWSKYSRVPHAYVYDCSELAKFIKCLIAERTKFLSQASPELQPGEISKTRKSRLLL